MDAQEYRKAEETSEYIQHVTCVRATCEKRNRFSISGYYSCHGSGMWELITRSPADCLWSVCGAV